MVNPCSLCRAECCKTYTLSCTSFDILRLAERSGRQPSEFAVLHEARLLCYDPDLVLDFSDQVRGHLIGIRSHPCFFLEDDRCSVHGHAPLSCRRYPFTVSGSLNARFCPLPASLLFRLKGPDISEKRILEELESYKGFVREWNESPGKKDECIGFLLGRTKTALRQPSPCGDRKESQTIKP